MKRTLGILSLFSLALLGSASVTPAQKIKPTDKQISIKWGQVSEDNDYDVVVIGGTPAGVATLSFAGTNKPNVILIYTDDHGYTDLGVHGIDKHVDTPIMDKLARGGALMTAGYSSAPQCQPSRAGLMVGRVQNEFALPPKDRSSDLLFCSQP